MTHRCIEISIEDATEIRTILRFRREYLGKMIVEAAGNQCETLEYWREELSKCESISNSIAMALAAERAAHKDDEGVTS